MSQQYGAGLEQLIALEQLITQEAHAAREMRRVIDNVVAAAEARGAKVTFVMDEIIIEEPQS